MMSVTATRINTTPVRMRSVSDQEKYRNMPSILYQYDFFVKKYITQLLAQCREIDSVILGCTHYPLLIDKIRHYMPQGIEIIEQGGIVAESLADYLHRHPEMECRCSRGGTVKYLTTENAGRFGDMASLFLQEQVSAAHIDIS